MALSGVDRFGVPNNAFGVVPEDFYGAVGRVVMVAALVEDTFASVVGRLTGLTEDDLAGQPISQLERKLDDVAATRPLPRRLVDARSAMTDAFKARHAVVHSLWSNPSMERARGWRPIIQRKRGPSGEFIVWTTHDADSFKHLISDLVGVHAQLRRVLDFDLAGP